MTDFEKAYEAYLKAASEHIHLDQLFGKLKQGVEANYPKILGWAISAAKERNLYRQ